MRYILLTIVLFVIVSGLNLTGKERLFSQEGVMIRNDSEDKKLLINILTFSPYQFPPIRRASATGQVRALECFWCCYE